MSYRRGKFRAVVPMSSMADIAFLLLIFFMVSSVLKVDAEIPLTLPDATGKQLEEKNDLRVSITEQGDFWLGNTPYPVPELIAQIKVAVATKPETLVLIQADGDLDFTVVEKFFDKLQKAGIQKIGMVTKKQKSSL